MVFVDCVGSVVDGEVQAEELRVVEAGGGGGLGRFLVWRHHLDVRKVNISVEPV